MPQTTIFVSYSHQDQRHLQQFQRFMTPLERAGLIGYWDDTRLRGGDDWYDEIDRALRAASVAVRILLRPVAFHLRHQLSVQTAGNRMTHAGEGVLRHLVQRAFVVRAAGFARWAAHVETTGRDVDLRHRQGGTRGWWRCWGLERFAGFRRLNRLNRLNRRDRLINRSSGDARLRPLPASARPTASARRESGSSAAGCGETGNRRAWCRQAGSLIQGVGRCACGRVWRAVGTAIGGKKRGLAPPEVPCEMAVGQRATAFFLVRG